LNPFCRSTKIDKRNPVSVCTIQQPTQGSYVSTSMLIIGNAIEYVI
jgi:hypothetical protein